MKKQWLAGLVILVATPAGAQEKPPVATPADPAGAAETGTANQTALSATAAQTARIAQDRATGVRNLAAYARSQAEYVDAVSHYEAEKAAVAHRNAEDAEAYRQRLASWQEEVARHAAPARRRPGAAARAEAPPSTPVCRFEQRTGSNMPVRVCR